MSRILICGAGSIGRRHLRNLKQLGHKDLMLYRSGRSTLPESELDGLPATTDLSEALERWQPAAALVTNPTARHLEVAIPAAEAGCHLFVEKPVSNSLDKIHDLEQALIAGGGRAMVGYHFRFNPGLLTVKRLVEEAEIGRPISARIYWGEYLPDWHPWEDYRNSYAAKAELGGGVVLTLSHPLDYVRWIFGEVVEVEAMTGNSGTLDIDVEDYASAQLRCENGVVVSLQLDYVSRTPTHWFEITGSEGTIRWNGMEGSTSWWKGKWVNEPPPDGYDRNSMFLNEMRQFLGVVDDGAEPACSLQDGVRALEVALMIHKAAREGAVVRADTAEVSL